MARSQSSRYRVPQFNCGVCGDSHALKSCRKFLRMNVVEKREAVKRGRYCINCLAQRHSKGSCRSHQGCRLCGAHHNTLLHRHPRLERKRPPSMIKEATNTISREVSESAVINLQPTLQVKVKTNHGKEVIIKALVDNCQGENQISRDLAKKLFPNAKEYCDLILQPYHDPHVKLHLKAKMKTLNMRSPIRNLPATLKAKFSQMVLADPKFTESSKVQVILGSEIFAQILQDGLLKREGGIPLAQRTTFGWILSGRCLD